MVDVHGRDVDAAADAAFYQIEVVGHVRTILVVDVVAAFRNSRDSDAGQVAEHLVVDLRVPPRSLDDLGQPLEPREADGGLHVRELPAVVRGQRIQPPHAFPELLLRFRAGDRRDVPDGKEREGEHARADEGMLPPARAQDALDTFSARPLFRIRKLPHFLRKIGIAHPREAPAVCVERLERLEAEEAAVPEGAGRLAVAGGTERVRTVLDHLQVVLPGKRHDRGHVTRHAVEMRRQDSARVRRDGALRRLRVQSEGVRVDVGEHRLESGHARYFRNHPEGERGDDDLGPGRYVERLQNKVKRHTPVFGGHGADVTAAAKHAEEFLLELRDVRSLDQLFLVAALRDDIREVRDHPHAEPADRSHRFVSPPDEEPEYYTWSALWANWDIVPAQDQETGDFP